MIFVTVGTRTEGFERLVQWMDDIAVGLNQQVTMQIGHTETEPSNTDWFRFKDDLQDIVDLTREADIVVGHGGAGTILTTLRTGTPIICVPRLEEHGENYDDHQLELTTRLEEKGAISVAETKDELDAHLQQSPDEFDPTVEADLVPFMRDRLDSLEMNLK